MKPVIAAVLRERGVFKDSPFKVIDAGCSIADQTPLNKKLRSYFGKDLFLHGFDPLIKECDRLREVFADIPGEYVFDSLFLGAADMNEPPPSWTDGGNDFYWERTLTCKVVSGREKDVPIMLHPNIAKDPKMSTIFSCIDAECEKYTYVDFIKIDIDQAHNLALRGARETLMSKNILAVEMEVTFGGVRSKYNNDIFTVGNMMREMGFTFLKMKDMLPYARSHFPSPFLLGFPAQTIKGQIRQADCIFVKDLAHRDNVKNIPDQYSPESILKLSCIYELYGLEDCAAEVLLTFSEYLTPLLTSHNLSISYLLDRLSTEHKGMPYNDFMINFFNKEENK